MQNNDFKDKRSQLAALEYRALELICAQKQKYGFWSDYYFLFIKFREKPVASQP